MSSLLLGVYRGSEGDYYVLNITENYRARLVPWFQLLAERIMSSLKTGTSIALIGPHGTGKSVLARYIAAEFAAAQYAIIDIGTSEDVFDSAIEVLHEMPDALGFYDPLGITFYDSPLLVRSEAARMWKKRCSRIIDRIVYLHALNVPTILVLPQDLYHYVPCTELLAKSAKLIDMEEYLHNVDARRALSEVFSSHAAALGCRDLDPAPYIDLLLYRHSDFSGVFPLAVYGAKIVAKRRCGRYEPKELYREAVGELSRLYQGLYEDLFFAENRRLIPAISLSLNGIYLPPAVAYLLPEVEKIAKRLKILEKRTDDRRIREDLLEELEEFYDIDEGMWNDLMWAAAPKEGVVREALSGLRGSPNVVEDVRTIYRGLIAVNQDAVYEFAKAVAYITWGLDPCRVKISEYLCYEDSVPPVVVEALTHGGRITAILATEPAIYGNEVEILTQLALVDARWVAETLLEKFVEILYGKVLEEPAALPRFYRLYRDYIEASAERVKAATLRKLALIHYFGETPQEATSVLKVLVKRAEEEGDGKVAGLVKEVMSGGKTRVTTGF
ncbi:MAG: hypothetical protein ACK4SY_00705 [Pyrobaculum sp.]